MSYDKKYLEKLFQEQYASGFEEKRLFFTKANETEYIVTMHYIHKYLRKNANIIDVGAGAGAYSAALADEGYFVDALDLHPTHIDRMNEVFKDSDKVKVGKADALDLSEFEDDSYDLVLELGPVYHIHNIEDRIKAIREAVRVARKGAPIFVAFCLQDAGLIEYIFQSENPAEEIKTIGYERETGIVTENTGSSRVLDTISDVDEVINKALQELPITRGPRFSQDGLSQIIRDSVNNMSEDSYKEWIKYLIATAERPDLIGYSNHIVQILFKN
ncbi:class I SAM-dependent methyltransferase [Butyrivibrio sp. AC2005]|uniref:class I SAM-dependent methyltransferase n=1 Tax=Butyrivibrio sp. AC2005 TaxID=1280672 RepID=UPI0003F731EB|nr:methyltransferase domain-containing protein [Butyrivibrio sp. AC2005]